MLMLILDVHEDGGSAIGGIGGLPYFDPLNDGQKCTIWEAVCHALFYDTPKAPELSAVNESAIYYVFKYAQEMTDDMECFREVWAEQLLRVFNEQFPESEEEDGDCMC